MAGPDTRAPGPPADDASSGITPPEPGDVWEMRVEVWDNRAYGKAVRYRVLTPHKGPLSGTRVMPRRNFEDAYDVDGSIGSRRVRILACDDRSVVYERLGQSQGLHGERLRIKTSYFLDNYFRWPDVPSV